MSKSIFSSFAAAQKQMGLTSDVDDLSGYYAAPLSMIISATRPHLAFISCLNLLAGAIEEYGIKTLYLDERSHIMLTKAPCKPAAIRAFLETCEKEGIELITLDGDHPPTHPAVSSAVVIFTCTTDPLAVDTLEFPGLMVKVRCQVTHCKREDVESLYANYKSLALNHTPGQVTAFTNFPTLAPKESNTMNSNTTTSGCGNPDCKGCNSEQTPFERMTRMMAKLESKGGSIAELLSEKPSARFDGMPIEKMLEIAGVIGMPEELKPGFAEFLKEKRANKKTEESNPLADALRQMRANQETLLGQQHPSKQDATQEQTTGSPFAAFHALIEQEDRETVADIQGECPVPLRALLVTTKPSSTIGNAMGLLAGLCEKNDIKVIYFGSVVYKTVTHFSDEGCFIGEFMRACRASGVECLEYDPESKGDGRPCMLFVTDEQVVQSRQCKLANLMAVIAGFTGDRVKGDFLESLGEFHIEIQYSNNKFVKFINPPTLVQDQTKPEESTKAMSETCEKTDCRAYGLCPKTQGKAMGTHIPNGGHDGSQTLATGLASLLDNLSKDKLDAIKDIASTLSALANAGDNVKQEASSTKVQPEAPVWKSYLTNGTPVPITDKGLFIGVRADGVHCGRTAMASSIMLELLEQGHVDRLITVAECKLAAHVFTNAAKPDGTKIMQVAMLSAGALGELNMDEYFDRGDLFMVDVPTTEANKALVARMIKTALAAGVIVIQVSYNTDHMDYVQTPDVDVTLNREAKQSPNAERTVTRRAAILNNDQREKTLFIKEAVPMLPVNVKLYI